MLYGINLVCILIIKFNIFLTQNDGDRKESTSESSLESSSGYSSQTAMSNATPDEGK